MVTEVIPNPDPSSKTDQAIDKAVAGSERVISARIDGIEKAIETFQADLTRVPTSVDRAIEGLKEVIFAKLDGAAEDRQRIHAALDSREADIRAQVEHLHDLTSSKIGELTQVTAERFTGVAAQFSERDTRTDQRAGDTKLAVDAAFAAAKEATSKIEMGFTKSIDGQQDLLKATTKSTDDKIGDLKDRMTAMESRTQGIGAAKAQGREDQNDSRGMMFGIIGIVIAIAAMVVTIITHGIK